ncbi:hypothetical protein [Rubellimicrobium roseum]|uniref:hypothetical protein n=1 Tax=Rubellimicrobium roseum TaxID=687525 RepID=UPI00159BE39A|nr:hypothetical protein [Rubellimicrobium roseum]
MRLSYLLVLLPATVSAVLGGAAYIRPDSGVDGTGGALLALAGAVAVAVGALIALTAVLRGALRGVLDALLFLGAALTAVAAWFLMQDAFAAAMALAALGVLIAVLLRPRRRLA